MAGKRDRAKMFAQSGWGSREKVSIYLLVSLGSFY
jgi:hypothetical protein